MGVFAVVPPSNSPATVETLNRIWAEVGPRHEYRQLHLAPDGSAAQFFGATPEDGATIQLPLLQVRSSIHREAAGAASDAQLVLKTMAQHLGVAQFFNLGVKYVFHVPAPGNDARAFIMRRLTSHSVDDLAVLERGGSLWTGVKYGITDADNRLLYVDIDVEYPRAISLDEIPGLGAEVVHFAMGAVKEYLEKAESST